MRTKSLMIIIIGILLLQPLLLGVSTPITSEQIGVKQEAKTLTQNPGTRLGPGEFTDHVPILINGTDDFVTQAWPGTGTEEDPYLFQGLNITHEEDLMGIHIFNTSAYVLIQDCYINQGSAYMGMYLENVSHVTVEYTTIIAEAMGIFVVFANNTQLSHSYVKSVSMGLYIVYSEGCILNLATIPRAQMITFLPLHSEYKQVHRTSWR